MENDDNGLCSGVSGRSRTRLVIELPQMTGSAIVRVAARQIFDSRGRPTLEADVTLADGSFGRACSPSGASTGRHEALELRDGDAGVYDGLGVLGAAANVNGRIADRIRGADAFDQRGIDAAMTDLDASPQFRALGGNAVLAVSLAVSRAAAASAGIPLYAYLNTLMPRRQMLMPMPMVNILSGGAHAGRAMDVQDFLVVPVGASDYDAALAAISRVRAAAAAVMADRGLSVLLADEGGLSPGFAAFDDALELMVRAFERAGLRPGEDVAIALDVAASEFARDGLYELRGAGLSLSSAEMVEYLADAVARYPIVSIEDALDQDDWSGWREATERLSGIQLIGDDLFATNPDRIREGIDQGVANSVLVKVNQNGTLSGAVDAMNVAWEGGFGTIVSARSGETEDHYIADLAVGSGSGQIKIGSVRNSERMAKYNQLARIDEEAGIEFAGMRSYGGGQARTRPIALSEV